MNSNSTAPPVANSVNTTCERLDICRATFYKAKKAGKIKTVKFGARTIVTEKELQRVAQEGW